MTPKEKADKLYNDAYQRWCYEISHEKNLLTAKDIALYVVKEVSENVIGMEIEWWEEVKAILMKK